MQPELRRKAKNLGYYITSGEMSEKIDIENLFRIKLSHLSPLLDAAKEVRKLPPDEQKRERIEWSIEYSRGEHLQLHIRLTYHIKPRLHIGTGEEILEEAILFEYTTPDGEHRQQDMELAYRESNLGKGYREYYFRDSSYNLCRTLYSDGWGIYGRQQLRGRARYKRQGESRKLRKLSKHLRADNILSSTKGRHLYWKDRLTPFAEQVLKARELRMEEPDIFVTFWEDGRHKRKKQRAPQGKDISYK